MTNALGVSLAAAFLSIAAPASAEPLERLARDVTKGASAGAPIKVAVLDFPYVDGVLSSGSLIVQEQLTTILAGYEHLEVLERRLMEKLLDELRLQAAGLIETKAATKFGSFLGVDAVIAGTLHDVGRETEVHARLIECRTGKVLGAASTRVKRTWSDAPLPAPWPMPAAAPAPAAFQTASFSTPPAPRPARRRSRTPQEEAEQERFFNGN